MRDTRTTGALLPEARTCLFRLGTDGSIEHAVSGSRFIVMASKTKIGIFPSDSVSTVILDPQISNSNKKATTSVLGASVAVPIATLSLVADDSIIGIQLAQNDTVLYVVTKSGLSAVSLTTETLNLLPVFPRPNLEAGFVVGDDFFAVSGDTIERISIVSGQVLASKKFGSSKSAWVGACSDNSVGFVRGGEQIILIDASAERFERTLEAKLAPQCGEVSSMHIVPGSAVVIAQKDVVSLFSIKEDELELVFQFRDAINKQTFSSVDVFGQFLVCISFEAFSGRDRLELFDLSFLKPKSAGLAPLRRWDISRLTAEVEHCKALFVKRDLLSFILTGTEGTASLWEPVVRDQWFSVMSNFEVLNRNEPYVETEEEFDFNQSADLNVVKRTINRYKKTENTVFDFIPGGEKGCQDTDQEMVTVSDDRTCGVKDEPFFPFLQPLSTWKNCQGPKIVPGTIVNNPEVKFFSPAAGEVLANTVARGI